MHVNNEKELYETCVDFFHFSLQLIREISPSNRNLKFAVVNIQITLELFIKYYLVRQGHLENIADIKNGKLKNYKKFDTIMNYYFSNTKWSYGEKKELKKILDARNLIVHKGLRSGWDNDLAIYIIKCVLFIHGTMLNSFGISLLKGYPQPNPISTNLTWREGIEQSIDKLNTKHNFSVFHCPECGAYSLIPSNIIGLDSNPDESLECLCCFYFYNIEAEAAVINCYKCSESKSYLIDRLNSDERQQHLGKCLECGINTPVRKCYECERFYHPNDGEFTFDNNYFCSSDCKEIYEECM
ncbi:hypothetical protein CEQ83_14300 [Priestia megaterium]|uniref:hypothetical protein n=1 Tax=Priestia megaterium TaxID=1404 RepID=UPI0012A8CBBB|nr:hypothetical protein [Priestia megaterium]QFY73643.1 hypothetical protein CEQ83_14300 [Priestia megaterium]